MLSKGSLECLELVDELRRIPDSGELIHQVEELYFGAAAKILVKMKKERDIL